MKHGFLVIDKTEGMSSNQVLGRIKKILQQKKMGHTGTLDPLATGVLAVALGKATRLIPYLNENEKVYQVEALLGFTSDTYDLEGRLSNENTLWQDLSDQQIEKELNSFLGVSLQRPPLYSALKFQGRALYRYAREGKEVPIPERSIEVFKISDFRRAENRVSFEISCSKGTYIRSIINDLGDRLGCGSLMSALRRVQSGPFCIDQAHTLESLEKYNNINSLDFKFYMDHLPLFELAESDLPNIVHGKLPHHFDRKPELKGKGAFRLEYNGELKGLAQIDDASQWQWLCNLS